jgi:hypothetical protein
LFSVGESWGTVEFNGKSCRLTVLGNALLLHSISLPNSETVTGVTVDGKDCDFEIANGKIRLGNLEIREVLCLE